MSQENVEIVRQALDAYARRDIEALHAVGDPNVVVDWSASEGWLAGVYRGRDETDRFYEGYFEAFEEVEGRHKWLGRLLREANAGERN